jgi:hypothetical protein
VAASPRPIDPDVGITDLVRRLGDDAKRLASDEVQLAKIETKQSVKRAGKGAMWLAMAFAVGIVTLVGLTLTLATLIGRLASGHMWVGALITGIVEIVLAVVCFKKGVAAFAEPSYTLEGTRAGAKIIAGKT